MPFEIPTALIVIGSIALFFVFLFTVHAHITIEFKDEFALSLRVLGIPIRILPGKPKKYKLKNYTLKKIRKRDAKADKLKAKKDAAKKAKDDAKAKKKADKEKLSKAEKKALKIQKKSKQPKIGDIVPLALRVAKLFFSRFFGKLHIKVARLHINVGSGDAATTAIMFGALYPAGSLFMSGLKKISHVKTLKNADVAIVPDYLSDKITFDMKLTFRVNLGGILGALLKAGFAFLFGWFKIKPDPDEFLKNYGNYMGDIPLPPLPQAPSSPFYKKEKEKDDSTGTESESSPPIDGHKPPKKHKKEKIKNERK